MKKPVKSMTLRSRLQHRAMTSPLRVEILGLFTDQEPRSVADMARHMGRPATALYYHVSLLERAGLLRRVGERREGRKPQALYLPAAEMFRLEQRANVSKKSEMPGVAAMAAALRMVERDMKAALSNPDTRGSGPYRNTLGARMHCRLSKKELAELNRRLRAVETFLMKVHKTHKPSSDDTFISLTLALMPLHNREPL